MPPSDRDPAYLWDMVDAARAAAQLIVGTTLQEYAANRGLQLATERALEIVGEAARRVSEPLKEAHPEIPWRTIIGLRNILVHEYGDIQHERLWRVLVDELPTLIEALARIAPLPGPDSD